MNLLQILEVERSEQGLGIIRAGGPGSGRHKETLEKHGWKGSSEFLRKSGDKAVSGITYKHKDFGNQQVKVDNDGAWSHVGQPTGNGGRTDGNNAEDLKNHLDHFHSKYNDKMAGGGPGSGRHPEGALKENGFSRDKHLGRRSGTSTQQDHWAHKDGSTYKITHQLDDKGKRSDVKSWVYRAGHNNKDSTKGTGGESLANHLDGKDRQGISRGEKDSMASRGCKGANCGRRSKAPGGMNSPRRSKTTKQEQDALTSKAIGENKRSKY